MSKTDHKVAASKRQLDGALRRARRFEVLDRRVVTARYDAANDRVCLTLRDGVEVCIPRPFLQGLESATEAQLSHIELIGGGSGLHWPELDVDHYVPGILDGIFGTKRWMSQLGRRGGTSTSPAKVEAARANGRKGGRPRKTKGKAARSVLPLHASKIRKLATGKA